MYPNTTTKRLSSTIYFVKKPKAVAIVFAKYTHNSNYIPVYYNNII